MTGDVLGQAAREALTFHRRSKPPFMGRGLLQPRLRAESVGLTGVSPNRGCTRFAVSVWSYRRPTPVYKAGGHTASSYCLGGWAAQGWTQERSVPQDPSLVQVPGLCSQTHPFPRWALRRRADGCWLASQVTAPWGSGRRWEGKAVRPRAHPLSRASGGFPGLVLAAPLWAAPAARGPGFPR